MQRASCCCSGSRSGCCCWAICMLHAKCLSIEFVWLSVATSCGSTLTFFCCLSICLVVVVVFVWFFFINHSSNCHQYYLRLTLPFYAAVCPFISLNDLLTAWGNGTWGIFMLRWVRQTSWCVRCERRTPVSIYICTCIICVSFAAAVSICTTNCLNS